MCNFKIFSCDVKALFNMITLQRDFPCISAVMPTQLNPFYSALYAFKNLIKMMCLVLKALITPRRTQWTHSAHTWTISLLWADNIVILFEPQIQANDLPLCYMSKTARYDRSTKSRRKSLLHFNHNSTKCPLFKCIAFVHIEARLYAS